MTKSKSRILVVDDDKSVAAALGVVLEHAGYSFQAVSEAREGLRRAYEEHPDLVLLDVGLPDQDGFTALDRFRDVTDVPIIMLTARTQPADIVRGLDGGAVDYITKPFDNDELLARIRSQLRQHRRSAARKPLHVVDEHLTLDFGANRLIVDGREVELTPIEWRVLRRLMESEGQVVSVHDLLRAGWGDDNMSDGRGLKVRIAAIRKKIGDDAREPHYVHTEREMGYRFEPH